MIYDDFELRKCRRGGYLAAISRADLDYKSLDKYRICSHHFINGEAASLYDTTNPAWLPTLYLGHTKVKAVNNDRYKRTIRRNALQEMEGQLPAIVKAEIKVLLQVKWKHLSRNN